MSLSLGNFDFWREEGRSSPCPQERTELNNFDPNAPQSWRPGKKSGRVFSLSLWEHRYLVSLPGGEINEKANDSRTFGQLPLTPPPNLTRWQKVGGSCRRSPLPPGEEKNSFRLFARPSNLGEETSQQRPRNFAKVALTLPEGEGILG